MDYEGRFRVYPIDHNDVYRVCGYGDAATLRLVYVPITNVDSKLQIFRDRLDESLVAGATSKYRYDDGLPSNEIVRHSPSRLYTRLRRSSRIRRSSVVRLLASARASVLSTPDGERRVFHRARLAQAWEDWQLHERRRDQARVQLESLYDQARALDPRLPTPVPGVISQCALARLLGELGPISDFNHWRQVLRYAGLNLKERESGTFKGMIRIARKGRPQLRRILNQIALPLVRKGCLFGAYFHHKREVQKMNGAKTMTAVSRKIVKMLWGWIHSGEAFDVSRVFVCKAAYTLNAA